MKFHLLFALLFVTLVSSTKVTTFLQRLETYVQQIVSKYQQGHQSDAFSTMMTIKLALDQFSEELDLPKPLTQDSTKECKQLIADLVGSIQHKNWIQNFEHIEKNINHLSAKCTNSDFKNNGLVQVEGGFQNTCALCVVLLRVIDNYMLYYRKNVTQFIQNEVCDFFNGTLRPTCQAFIHYTGPTIITTVLNGFPADKACLTIGMCNDPKCKIVEEAITLGQIKPLQVIPSWQWIIQLFTKHFGDSHLPPLFDLDNDTFSDLSTFRGYDWRGVDCDEFNSNVYPGRKVGNKAIDHDCNGIYGADDKGQLYEKTFCDNTHRLGVAVIGDSAGAHFSIPEKYFNVTMIEKGTYKDFLRRAADELDIPQQSGYTGHTNTQYLSHSMYKYLREWNLCNNNDYQNLGVNGGDSGNTWGNIKALKRDPQNDYPLLIFLELIGNDVCQNSLDRMTTTTKFKQNIIRLLDWLDTTVPAGSHLWIFGLGDGSILYQNLYNTIHPLNVTYKTVYDFLNCLDISPCQTWLNSNQTIRHTTSERAANLSKVFIEIIKERKYINFDMVYKDFPAMQILERRLIEGGDPKDMIERCDGFHPNGLFHSYLADWTWYKIQTQYPEWIGAQNPHNAQIRKRFNLTEFKDPGHKQQLIQQ